MCLHSEQTNKQEHPNKNKQKQNQCKSSNVSSHIKIMLDPTYSLNELSLNRESSNIELLSNLPEC